MKYISHCHSFHSFDSQLPIENIIKQLIKNEISVISINDHDVYSLTTSEVEMFTSNGIVVIPAIEFTTSEGVHIIGLHSNIKSLEKKAYDYSAKDLILALMSLGAKVCLPHPSHLTGVHGNLKINSATANFVVANSNAFEINNYRYGQTPQVLIDEYMKINPKLIQLIGADAHKESEINSFINVYSRMFDKNIESQNLLNYLFSQQPEHLKKKERDRFYFSFKKFQKSKFYQNITNIISHENRKKIKSLLKSD
jgi:histidinol phosphatase-like PHP family hydrolase